MSQSSGPAVVTAHVWTLHRRHVAFGLLHAAAPSALVRRRTGARFAKLLGTGRGETFTAGEAQLRTWALITTWDDEPSARSFEDGGYARGWARRSATTARLTLVPLSSRGTWSGAAPFGARGGPAGSPSRPEGQVAALTRARIRPRRLLTFWRAVGPVAGELRAARGCRWAIGIGEAPIGWQGTLSVWDSASAMEAFAYRGAAHAAVVARTPTADWYAEELFARFAVLSASGLPSRPASLGRTT
ncbi:MAG: putative spheroidene monooxygenase [Jatrophihabitantaceae bacterium]|nr:putative spheroidene monooxygenase [Jatrophihabitantaceae bacterium]